MPTDQELRTYVRLSADMSLWRAKYECLRDMCDKLSVVSGVFGGADPICLEMIITIAKELKSEVTPLIERIESVPSNWGNREHFQCVKSAIREMSKNLDELIAKHTYEHN